MVTAYMLRGLINGSSSACRQGGAAPDEPDVGAGVGAFGLGPSPQGLSLNALIVWVTFWVLWESLGSELRHSNFSVDRQRVIYGERRFARIVPWGVCVWVVAGTRTTVHGALLHSAQYEYVARQCITQPGGRGLRDSIRRP